MPWLGRFGRLGNQMFQYAYAAAMVAKMPTGGRVAIPGDCDVNRLFDLLYADPDSDRSDDRIKRGYFLHPHHLSMYSRSFARLVFKPREDMMRRWMATRDRMPDVVIHKRRGDYERYPDKYAIPTDASYQRCLETYGLEDRDVEECSEESGGDPFMDFLTMMHARVLIRSNSSFSWWAATLGRAEVFCPVIDDDTGWLDCEFVRGNHTGFYKGGPEPWLTEAYA